jgi:hypothetical protein
MEKYIKNKNAQIFVQLLALLVVSRAFMAVMVPVYNGIMGTDRSFSFLMNEWDAKRYCYMVENGYTFPLDYDPQANWAFFPLYVLVCMGVKALTFWKADTYYVGMTVSNVCIFVASFVTVKYLRNLTAGGAFGDTLQSLNDKKVLKGWFSGDVLLVGFLMFMAPYTFYSSSMYTEAMFIMFIALTFYACQQNKFLLAGLMAAFASATRIVGCTLVFPLIMEMYRYYRKSGVLKSGVCGSSKINAGENDLSSNNLNKNDDVENARDNFDNDVLQNGNVGNAKFTWTGIANFIVRVLKNPLDLLSILICPLGTFAYMGFLRFFCGDVWAFLHVQIAWREDEYFPIFGVLWKACTGQIEPRYTYMGWFCIGILAMYVYMFVKKHYSMAVFGVISLLVPLCSHVMSTCRFTVGSYVIYIAFYDLLGRLRGNRGKDVLRWVIIFAFLAVEALLIFNWYNSDCWLM